MTRPSPFYSMFLAVGLSVAAVSAQSETFSVNLGKTVLGTLSYAPDATGAVLTANFTNTPLGVFDGTFKGTSRKAQGGVTFVGISKSTRKTREVTVNISKGRAEATTIQPAAEETPLSDPAKAPNGVVDPVRAVGAVLRAKGCPGRVNIYDGRRAIALLPGGSDQTDGQLTCNITYKVTHGPGHLSPLRIKKASMQVIYNISENTQSVAQIKLGSGVFKLLLNRTK